MNSRIFKFVKRRRVLQLAAFFVAFGVSLSAVCMLLGAVRQEHGQLYPILADVAVDVKEEVPKKRQLILLDAGHGGMDAGATVGSYIEKDLNLQLALLLEALLRQAGFTVLLTRSDDRMLGDGAPGSKKLADLQARLTMTEEYPDAWLVSIHMNKFPDAACMGVTVYYSGNRPESMGLATRLQERVLQTLQPENHRALKKATSAIYLLHRTKIPAVLVECGFLSNSEEAALLATDEYQAKLALVLASGICAYQEEIRP